MFGQEEGLISKLVTFYKAFEFEFSQYEYDNDVYFSLLVGMAEDYAEDVGLPAESLVNFVWRVH